jgi:hypothetical protein
MQFKFWSSNWNTRKHFGTCRRTGHESSFQPGVLSASDALQKIQTRRKRPRIRVRNNKRRPASRISAQAGQVRFMVFKEYDKKS